ncbi:hypothetical protein GN244_ATG16767 [Phytophthora infestans]|uniref:Uncharacterized protein n=1 Tax=Phytophthora infestans TaxID=4787 RepID=A0A833SPV1_PHYIN|nr:hypothetical protein GN244_ATG16767 [Phytophthora infestans]
MPLVPMLAYVIRFCYEWGHESTSTAMFRCPDEEVRYHQVGTDRCSVTSDLCASNKRSSVKSSPLTLVPMLAYVIGFCYEWGRIHVNGHVAFSDENVRIITRSGLTGAVQKPLTLLLLATVAPQTTGRRE